MSLPKKYGFLILIMFTAFYTACTPEETVLDNEELIFSNSFPISVNEYHYSDTSGKIYTVSADTNFTLPPDTVNDQPVISWDCILTDYISAGIFTEPVNVIGTEIVNSDHLVWQWHSGMGFDSCYIQYSQGKNVINGVIIYENDPFPLAEGHYYWALWAWGTGGVKILFSSKQREFYVRK